MRRAARRGHSIVRLRKGSYGFASLDIGGCAEAGLSLSADAALFTNKRVVPVNLAGKSRPAMGDISQKLGLSFDRR
jgi:hypothetical protein